MNWKSSFVILAAALALGKIAGAATVGQVVPIGGQSADLALDEPRGVLYIANFTANRIDVMSLSDMTVHTSINVAAQPSSLALSADDRFLVITHFSNFAAPATANNGLTVIDLNTNGRQTFALSNPPLGVAFGLDNLALVVTTQEYLLFDPVSGATQLLNTIANVTASTLPVLPANMPGNITQASMATSADGLTVYGLGSSTGTFTFKYDVLSKQVGPGGIVLSSGVLGPRIVSLNQDASKIMAGWTMIDAQGTFINYFKNKSNQFSTGTTVFDNGRGLLYAQIPAVAGEAPVLQITDPDNLNVLDRLQLTENFTGKSIISSDGNTLYGASDSGVMILPIGNLNAVPRLSASVEDLVFRGNYCDRSVATQQITISDPGNNKVPFTIVPSAAGVTVSPSSGVTPAVINVSVDPNAFGSQKGTTTVTLAVQSTAAVNIAPSVRVLINEPDPDQRGTSINIPGTLSDLIADPARNRYYVLRQDKNQLLVFDGSNNSQIATLKTYNSPVTMAVTYDDRYILIGHNSSQAVAVYDLDTLQAQPYLNVEAGAGNEARSIAVSAGAILAASVDYQGNGHVIQLDLATRSASQLPTLGIFSNANISPSTVAVASANGSSIMFASIDGTTMMYDSNAGTFTAGRKDFKSLNGAYAASNFGTYVVGSNVLNSSLVPVGTFETSSGTPSGFFFIDQSGFRTTSPTASSPGIIERVNVSSSAASLVGATRMAEAPLSSATGFTRSLAVLYSRTAIVNLTVSGVTVLPWSYDASVAPPQLTSIVNAADQSPSVAPGALVTVYGNNLSPVNLATTQIPLPTALADSCLTINGLPVPMFYVSPNQVNAQLPFQATGNVTMIFETPGGVSNNFNLTIQPQAPAVFQTNVDGISGTVPSIYRLSDQTIVTDSNPIHPGDELLIFAGGMGQTLPVIDAGSPSPTSPIAVPLVSPTATLGGVSLAVNGVGLQPGQIGIYQIDVTVPRGGIPTGLAVPLVIKQGSATTSFAVRVVN
ncbi:MAG TPA: hypothetical protein VGL72_32830 [Bryobacteraceae bacterium]|jgi:uncharacterized protein (TIGR03437 family)